MQWLLQFLGARSRNDSADYRLRLLKKLDRLSHCVSQLRRVLLEHVQKHGHELAFPEKFLNAPRQKMELLLDRKSVV